MLAGREIGAIGLGCMSFGGMYGPADDDQSLTCLQAALDLGVTHWDVAEVYGGGRCEEILGEFLRGASCDVTIATKAGIYSEPKRLFSNAPDRLRASLEGSLTRLGRDRVELFYVHRREPERPVEEVTETLARFIAEGLIGGFGFSEIAPYTLRRAHAVHPVAAVQNEYSLWTRQPELGLVQTCREIGTAFVAFSPVARGMFGRTFPDPATFRPGDIRIDMPRFHEPNLSMNKAAIRAFKTFCDHRDWPPAAAAIAWLLDQGEHIIPIPGTRNANHLRELAEADGIAFSDEDRAEIDRILPVGFAQGDRYSEGQNVGIERYC
jgi:aryl-alcohol dehydrogenase-like predicted oxidoreductase